MIIYPTQPNCYGITYFQYSECMTFTVAIGIQTKKFKSTLKTKLAILQI